MLNSISWGTFFTWVALATVVYYVAIGLLFYRTEIRGLLSGNVNNLMVKRQNQPGAGIAATNEKSQQPGAEDRGEARQLENILNEVRYEIIPKAGEHPTKAKLAIVFQHYFQTLKGNYSETFRISVIQLMAGEAVAQCGISFEEEELNQLW
ncbi:hypothetical protein BDD43_0824 [Mucilaginibacter gracilis]|uniref:Uncharacterized protein n=1 Tax=Mucilaginibacter gracilis TaxID=423350 RepID=A0A495IVU8_9SPHI|nr:hypothetical protein [Mucilaginibacter gracilis]RKR80692.1 hypothetical protein BDD43_0824 [Mucilaginibacter gracilis]